MWQKARPLLDVTSENTAAAHHTVAYNHAGLESVPGQEGVVAPCVALKASHTHMLLL